MRLPFSFNLGTSRYSVSPSMHRHSGAYGDFYPNARHLVVAVRYGGKRRNPQDIAETFWHETTHAILRDMDHPLWNDEKFVTAFSKRLTQVIYTARFA